MTCKKHEYNFVGEPSDKLKCLICLGIADNPKQHEKCGKIFCSECIEKCKGKPCPACNIESPDYFSDTRGAQEIRDLRIRCVNFDRGCDWPGSVGTLCEHLKMCELVSVPCKYRYIGCDVTMTRKDMAQHEKEEDKKHLHLALESAATPTLSNSESLVIKISDYGSLRRSKERFYSIPFYTHSHGYKVCLRIDANGCGSGEGTHLSVFLCLLKGPFDGLLQWPFTGTVSIELLNQKSDCNHHGDEMMFVANESARPGIEGSWGKEEFISQCKLSNESYKTQYLRNDMLYFRVGIKLMNHQPWLVSGKQVNAAASSLRSSDCQTHVFIVDGYCSRNEEFFSSNFFVRPGGYLLYAGVFPNGFGSGKGTHVSVYFYSVEGPFDANLPWPIVGSVKLELLNQQADEDHYVRNLEITEETNLLVGGCWGSSRFIRQDELLSENNRFLKDDALYFRVTVKVADCKPWLTCTLSSVT